MNKRYYLKSNITLCGFSDGKPYPRTFRIIRRMGRGGMSSICYEAFHEGSGRGVLKEFYPNTVFGLRRNDQNQLIHSSSPELRSQRIRFQEAKQEYLMPYELLLDIKQQYDDRGLGSFIPEFEIYYSVDSEGQPLKTSGTVYIWTPTPKLETFDKICIDIHRHPTVNPEKKLVEVLYAIRSLTECVRILHNNAIVHRDIKPENFGFIKREDETLTQAISLFDIDSLCLVYGKKGGEIGTDGYMDPESRPENPETNQSDIYSIGATMFTALICSPEIKEQGYRFRPEFYDRIKELVDSSKLIQASESNSHPRLRNAISTILKRCLCSRVERYENCEELLEDLDKALYYAVPSEIARNHRGVETWVLKDVEKGLDQNREKNSLLVMQYHLYEHPLYRSVGKEEKTIRILVLGFANYGQKFLDTCLQAGQMIGKSLEILVIAEDGVDQEIYLSERPSLAEFFDVDGSLAGRETSDSYGKISFSIVKADWNDPQSIASSALVAVHEEKSTPIHSVFVSLGNDSLNKDCAGILHASFNRNGTKCNVNYISEDEIRNSSTEGLFPVNINADVRNSTYYPDIERMAFNVHMIWDQMNVNGERFSLRESFRKRYNHDSCVSSVLAVKYKLFSIGIDLEETGTDKAAVLYAEKKKWRKELIWIEHRRWVTEKLCNGWQNLRPEEACRKSVTKDERQKKHICILPSCPDLNLSEKYLLTNDYSFWDGASEEELQQLDALDRMSVHLHQLYRHRSEETKQSGTEIEAYIQNILSVVESDWACTVALEELAACARSIWDGSVSGVGRYKSLKKTVDIRIDALSDHYRNMAKERMIAFEQMFHPILAGAEYRDYKKIDMEIVDNLPFVLTYTDNVNMVIPFSYGKTERRLQNVAASVVVKPRKITYLCLWNAEEEYHQLMNAIQSTVRILKKRTPITKVEVEAAVSHGIREDVAEQFMDFCRSFGIRKIKMTKFHDREELISVIQDGLKWKSGGNSFLAIEKNQTTLSSLLEKAKAYHSYPCFKFDTVKGTFTVTERCGFFKHIICEENLFASDVISLSDCTLDVREIPEFYSDYGDFWKIYHDDPNGWDQLSNCLKEYSQRNDVIATIDTNIKCDKIQEYRYILPSRCGREARRLIGKLMEYDAILPESHVFNHSTDSCEVIIREHYQNRSSYDAIMSRVDVLSFADSHYLYEDDEKHSVHVVFDRLKVDHMLFPSDLLKPAMSILNRMYSLGFILNLIDEGNGYVSFIYSTKRIKELLTSKQRIVEVYTYHYLKENSFFDDVELGKLNTNDHVFNYSLSVCTMTKGFRSLSIIFAYPEMITEEFFSNIHEIRENGINPIIMIDMNTSERKNCIMNSKLKRNRYTEEQEDEIPIFDLEKIQDYDKFLDSLLTRI